MICFSSKVVKCFQLFFKGGKRDKGDCSLWSHCCSQVRFIFEIANIQKTKMYLEEFGYLSTFCVKLKCMNSGEHIYGYNQFIVSQ